MQTRRLGYTDLKLTTHSSCVVRDAFSVNATTQYALRNTRYGAEVTSLQPPYSMLHREAEDGVLDYCARNNIGVLAYSPMQRGLLTGKFSRQYLAKLAPDDHRRENPDFREPQFSATLELVDKLRPIAKRNGRTLAQLAIAWVLRRPQVTVAIVGARRPSQIIETAPASDWNLSKEDIEEIEKLLGNRQEKLK